MRVRIICVFLLVLFFSCSPLCCPRAFCQAQPGKTTPTDLAVEWVDASGKVPPQLTIRCDYLAYPDKHSVHAFLAAPKESSPEAFLAHYLQALPDTQAALAYRDPTKDKTAAAKAVANDQIVMTDIVDLRLNLRYDVGAFTLLEGTYVDTKGKTFSTAYYGIYASPEGYHITYKGTSPPDTAVGLFFTTGWDFYNLGSHWNDAPKPKYQYSFNLPGSFPTKDASFHPATVLFNGKPSHLLIDSSTVATDPITAFVKHAVQVYRSGTQSQWLALWTPTDRKENWDPSTLHIGGNYSRERPRFDGVKLEQVFTIDFGPNAVVFFADAAKPSSRLSYLILWKEGTSDYRLTNGVELKSGVETFTGNLEQFVESSEFRDYLRSITGLPAEKKVKMPPAQIPVFK